jgi:hypothetical protein
MASTGWVCIILDIHTGILCLSDLFSALVDDPCWSSLWESSDLDVEPDAWQSWGTYGHKGRCVGRNSFSQMAIEDQRRIFLYVTRNKKNSCLYSVLFITTANLVNILVHKWTCYSKLESTRLSTPIPGAKFERRPRRADYSEWSSLLVFMLTDFIAWLSLLVHRHGIPHNRHPVAKPLFTKSRRRRHSQISQTIAVLSYTSASHNQELLSQLEHGILLTPCHLYHQRLPSSRRLC